VKKRIFVLLVLLCFLSQFDVTKAQEQTYLPIILSSGEKNMTSLAILEITDGITTVNLLSKKKETGFHLLSWRPQIIQSKDGGIYQDSSIAPGRDLVFAVDGTANEIFNTRLNGDSQDDLIQSAQDLLRLLTKARNYSLTSWQDTPVYIKARAACETNTRYALIKNFTIQDVDNPYAQPFFTANALVVMNNISIGIERGHWLGSAPGTGECAEISSYQNWEHGTSTWLVAKNGLGAQVVSLIQLQSGRILAGLDNGEIWKSDDNGLNWALLANGFPAFGGRLFETSGGTVLCGGGSLGGELWISNDRGANWTLVLSVASGPYSFAETLTGRLLTGVNNGIYASDNNGLSWYIIVNYIPSNVWSLLATPYGDIYAGTNGNVWQSFNNGDSWQLVSAVPVDGPYSLGFMSEKIFGGDNSQIDVSLDGIAWSVSTLLPGGAVWSLLQTSGGIIFAGDNGQIIRSNNGGVSWAVDTTLPVGFVTSLLQISNGTVFAGENGQIWKSSQISVMGLQDSCDDIVFLANKQNVSNLTHIYRDDGGVFSANLFPMTLPTTLLPAVPAVNDAIYFGIDNAIVNTGTFTSLVFDLSIGAVSTTSYTITWEYWTGAAWAALTIKDGTNAGIGALSNLGVNSVHWTPPSSWAAVAVNGITGYWVRARLSALVGVLTPPVQQNRNIYSVVNGYIEIASTEVLGDIPALSQILAHNRSDLDGPGGAAPNLYENRLIVGLRSYDRGPAFQAYLNAADEQNPFGLTASIGTNTTFGNDINAPTGRSATYNPAGVEAMATRVLYTFGPTIARDYYGRFHAFVRAYRDGGASTDFTVRLQITNGSGGVSYTTDTAQLATTTRFEVLDFGMIKLPVAGSLGLSELGDTTTIAIQASAANAAVNLIIFDLILIPTDEWAIDNNDKTNSTLSEVGKSGGFDKVLNIDSVTMPKFPIRSVVQRFGSNLITAIYNSVTPGEAILQANVQQRLWFFAMTTSATGAAYSWLAQPEISHSIQLYKSQRYLSLRGDR
jgi:hypothetical protein